MAEAAPAQPPLPVPPIPPDNPPGVQAHTEDPNRSSKPSPAAPPGDDLTLIVAGQRFTGWQNVRVMRGIEAFPSYFQLRVTERNPGQPGVVSVLPGQTCQVMIGRDLVLTGYADTYAADVAPGRHSIAVVGRSETEDLVDCAAGVRPGEEPKATMTYTVTSLKALAEELCAPFGVAVTEPDGEGQPMISLGDGAVQITIPLGQSVYATLEPLARWRQMLLLDGTDGGLILGKVGTKMAAGVLAMPGAVERAAVEFRKQERFTIYLPAFSSFDAAYEASRVPGVQGNFYTPVPDPAAFKGQPRRDGKPRYRPMFVISEQLPAGISLAELRAKWERSRRYGRSQAVRVVVSTWRDRAGTLWAPNTLVQLDMPALKLRRVTWLLAEVTFLRDRRGTRAELLLMPPEAFSSEPTLNSAFNAEIEQALREVNRSAQAAARSGGAAP